MRSSVLPFALKALSSVLVGCAALQAHAAPVTVRIEAFIDGVSYLRIQGDTVWWDHEAYFAPGQGESYVGFASPPLPTTINEHEWLPDWSKLPPFSYFSDYCVWTTDYSCSSDRVSGLLPALAATNQSVLLTTSFPGHVFVQSPTADNDYTASIAFFDFQVGARWYNIELTYDTPEVPLPAAAWLFGTGLAGLAGFARRRKTV